MIPLRTQDTYAKHLSHFANEVYVVCPSCHRQAIVQARHLTAARKADRDIKLTCTACGHNKRLEDAKSYTYGAPIDPYFRLPLWLAQECIGNTLWAYNYENLEFLKRHIEAHLRERHTQITTNGTIGSRLPRWMTSRKNRDVILKVIDQLRNKPR